MKRIIAINFKTYKESTGENALILAKKLESVAKLFPEFEIIVCVQATDVFCVSHNTSLTVFGQHFDPFVPDKNTGFITLHALVEAGAKGSLLNHSEHRIRLDQLESCITLAKSSNFRTIVCANDPFMVAAIASFNPDFIAYEPPELIEGDISVSEAKSEQIRLAISFLRNHNYKVPLLVGAGIKKKEDLKAAFFQGAEGILVASGIVKAKDPAKVLEEWLSFARG